MRFEGKRALVTGAQGGIGAKIVEGLLAEGAAVAATDLSVPDLPKKNAEGLVAIAGDLTDRRFCDKLPERAASELGGLDFLFNNAGIIRRGAITEATDNDYQISMAVNVEAPFRLCRAAIPILAQGGGGAIVNTASCWGLYPGPNHPVYVMSKAALISLTRCLGRDHAHQNIRVNAVCPNEVDTPMLRSGFLSRGLDPDTAVEQLNQSVPLGHVATPAEIADVALFLASPEARYMCGAIVEVNGGKPVS